MEEAEDYIQAAIVPFGIETALQDFHTQTGILPQSYLLELKQIALHFVDCSGAGRNRTFWN